MFDQLYWIVANILTPRNAHDFSQTLSQELKLENWTPATGTATCHSLYGRGGMWGDYGMLLGWLWDVFGMIMECLWDGYGMSLGWLWYVFLNLRGMIMGFVWDVLGWLSDVYGMFFFGWSWDVLGMIMVCF